MATRAKRKAVRAGAAPVLRTADFRRHLRARAALMAPADVRTLVAQAALLRRRAARDGVARPAFRRQVDEALALLADHLAGRSPQIPYSTIGTLAAALFYYLDPIDVIPDWVPGVGTGDDALVMRLAFKDAAAGIERWERARTITARRR